MLDQILFNTEIINKSAQKVYKRLNKPQKGFQYKPLECNKPKTLRLSSMKAEWETLSGWIRNMKEYISSGNTDPEACNHTATVRMIIKGLLHDHIKQRVEPSLDAATTVEQLYKILKDQETIFWPQDKRLKTFMGSTRKNSNDPMGFLSKLCKK